MVHGIIALFCIKLLKLSECLQFSNCLLLHHPMTSFRRCIACVIPNFKSGAYPVMLVQLKQFINLCVNIENRKTALNHKGNKFLEIAGEKIKNEERKKPAKIIKNKVVFSCKQFYFNNLDSKSILQSYAYNYKMSPKQLSC